MSDEIYKDPRYSEACEIVYSTGKTNIVNLQREMMIGYNRAARLIEDMEKDGIVSSIDMYGRRKLLRTKPGNETEHTEHCNKRQLWGDGECECQANNPAEG